MLSQLRAVWDQVDTQGTTFFISPETGLVGVVMSQNEPGEFSGLPVEIFIVQGMAFAGL